MRVHQALYCCAWAQPCMSIISVGRCCRRLLLHAYPRGLLWGTRGNAGDLM